ncbi:MAG: hypothetical protein OEM49_08860 [Myxococcales bacterium]|nr:hypothetical protein [Myxococcales bacterium]MDH5307270.1 hypothetical protein [Myxococcales bacterium]MDH5567275.1 hypothetical protein [Myxococcales bacterium]
MVLLTASEAHAQRIPEILVWSAGVSVFAPFVAVPVKIGILRLLRLEARASRLWLISAIEWVLWFPVAFLLLRSGSAYALPLNVVLLFALAVWLHKERVPNTSWRSALCLALPTPSLALLLPFLTLCSVAFLETLSA